MIHEIRFDVETPALQGKQLDLLVQAYLADRRKKSQSSTIKGYRFKLTPFLRWWHEVGPGQDWLLGADDLTEYEIWLSTIGWNYNSRVDAIKRLRQLFRWAHATGRIPVDFSIYIPRVKGAAPVRLPLSLDDLAALLNACWRMSNPLRNRAIIATLAGTGLRREECASLRVEHTTIHPDGAGYLQPSVTKNDKPRIVAFDAATGSYIQQWLALLDYSTGPLFPSRKGGTALSPDGLYKVVLDAAKLAHVNVETHDLRRLFATTFAKTLPGEGYGRLLQMQLGHASYNTTSVYTLQQIDDVLSVLRSTPVSPIARLNTP